MKAIIIEAERETLTIALCENRYVIVHIPDNPANDDCTLTAVRENFNPDGAVIERRYERIMLSPVALLAAQKAINETIKKPAFEAALKAQSERTRD